MSKPNRSDEPIWWALFSAGGVCFAVLLPGLILIWGMLWPLGLVNTAAISYQNILTLTAAGYGIPAILLTVVAICLPLFHAAHRIHHGLHDLKLGNSYSSKVLCYGLATALSLLALSLVYLLV